MQWSLRSVLIIMEDMRWDISFVTMRSIIVEEVSVTRVGLVMIKKKKNLLDLCKFMYLCAITDRVESCTHDIKIKIPNYIGSIVDNSRVRRKIVQFAEKHSCISFGVTVKSDDVAITV